MLGPADILEECTLRNIAVEVWGNPEAPMFRFTGDLTNMSMYLKSSILVNKEGVLTLLNTSWDPNAERQVLEHVQEWLLAGCSQDQRIWGFEV